MSFTYAYPHMAVAVDVVLFTGRGADRRVLLIRRANPPFQGGWALPGGYVDMDETAAAAARRELREETGVDIGDLRFVGYFDALGRDPRERTLSLAFAGEARAVEVTAGDDAAEARWFLLSALPDLAFDHAQILAAAACPPS